MHYTNLFAIIQKVSDCSSFHYNVMWEIAGLKGGTSSTDLSLLDGENKLDGCGIDALIGQPKSNAEVVLDSELIDQ